MKQYILCACAVMLVLVSQAQRPTTYESDDDGGSNFSKDRIFIGGSLNVGFASNTLQLGAVPEIGYSVTNWLDAGIGLNVNYASERADPYYNGNVRYRSFNYGGGPFVRLYPIRFIFIQGQFEQNWIKQTAKDFNSGYSASATYQSQSFIAGIGYTQRIIGQSGFYTMIGLDLLTDPNSPYRDAYNNAAIPIIRAGFNFYLKSRKK